tara:strand:+ start:8 stop:1078 length:1071 start_codon:yes stop_codon:yes gene_type:complete
MNKEPLDIKTVVARVITDKPVRKTPYQVKGVFIRQYPKEKIIPMLNGSYRNKFLYPRVQVKILNEQIYLIGIDQGADPIIQLCERMRSLDFGNITFEVEDYDLEFYEKQFIISKRLVRYKFITPWVALNHMTSGKYKALKNNDKQTFLSRILGQNIIFIASEIGNFSDENIYAKVKVPSIYPKPLDENKWGAFQGEFKTNFILPNYVGIGNGITRGLGAIYGLFNHKSFSFDEKDLKKNSNQYRDEEVGQIEDLQKISFAEVPKPRRNRSKKLKNKKHVPDRNKTQKKYKTNKKFLSNKSSKLLNRKRKKYKHRRTHSEDYIVEHETVDDRKKDGISEYHDQKFNTEQYHKKQHKF